MIDVKFDEAMRPLAKVLREAQEKHKDKYPLLRERHISAAVVEALGIPAQMVASPEFMADLKLLVSSHVSGALLPPIRADEPESITEPGLPSFADGDDPMRTSGEEASHIPDPPACGAPTDNAM